MRLSAIFLVVVPLTLFGAVHGITNTQTVSGSLSAKSQLMIEQKAKTAKEIMESDLLDAAKSRREAIERKYLLIRKIKELQKRRYFTRRATLLEMRKTRKVRCTLLNAKIADADMALNELYLLLFTEAVRRGLPLSQAYFYFNLLSSF